MTYQRSELAFLGLVKKIIPGTFVIAFVEEWTFGWCVKSSVYSADVSLKSFLVLENSESKRADKQLLEEGLSVKTDKGNLWLYEPIEKFIQFLS